MTRLARAAITTVMKFPASAKTPVDTFHGHCIILLTGAAISIKRLDGSVIAEWPYNCIRQFRAEDETKTFSFLSGRRGPFGIAEYVFEIHERVLTNLQEALTQFTGAQFNQQNSENRRSTGSSVSSVGSSITPGTNAYGEDPSALGSRRPLPSLPTRSSKHQTMSVSQLPIAGEYMYHKGRVPSTLPRYHSESAMGLTPASPPMLPTSIAGMTRHSPSHDPWELRPESYASIGAKPALFKDRPLPPSPTGQTPMRPRMPQRVDMLSGGVVSQVPAYATSVGSPKRPLPGSPGGRRLLLSPTGERPSADAMGRRDSEMSDVFSTGSESTGEKTSPLGDYSTALPNRRGTAPDVSLHMTVSPPGFAPPPPPDTRHLARQQTAPTFATVPMRRHHYEDAEVRASHPKGDRRSDPESRMSKGQYDHLPLSQEADGHRPPLRSQSYSPEARSPQATTPPKVGDRRSMSPADNVSNLDFVPRSSPHVQHRTITPEFAQHLAKFGQDSEKLVNLSPVVKGKRSPEIMKRRAETLQKQESSDLTYDSPRPAHPLNYPPNASQAARLDQAPAAEGLYQSPRSQPHAQETEVLYNNVPYASHSHLYEDPREQIIDENDGSDSVYYVPRPRDPNAHTNLYQVPPVARSRAPLDTYDSPRSTMPMESMYNVPRSEGMYNVPRSEGMYNVPRAEDVYNVPRSESDYNNVPRSQGMYNVPRAEGAYNVPRSALQAHLQQSENGGTYSFPRPASENSLSSHDVSPDAAYDYPRPNALRGNNLYNIPPGAMSRQHAAESQPMSNGQYEQVEEAPVFRRLRPARSFESLFTRRVRPAQSGDTQGGSLPEVVSTKSNPYVDIDLKPPPPTQRRDALPAIPPSPESENVYAEIPDNPRFRYIAGPKRRGSQENMVDYGSPREDQHSLYHVPRPKASTNRDSLHASSPQSPMYAVIPGEGEQIGVRVPLPHRAATISRDPTRVAQNLADEGYELCLPANQSLGYRMATLPHGSSRSPPRNVPRKNYKDLVEKFGRQVPNGIRHRIQSDQTDTDGMGRTELQPSSVPEDSVLSDEYVIITKGDPRQKTQPQDIPPQPERCRSSTGDEYEVMSSVHVNLRATTLKSPSPIPEARSTHVSISPLQSPSGRPRTLQKRSTTAFEETTEWRRGGHAHTGSSDSTSPKTDSDRDSLVLEGVSPSDRTARAPRVIRTQASVEGREMWETVPGGLGGRSATISESVPIPHSKLVRIASGSPNDRAISMDLRNRSRSFGNYLEHPHTKPHTYVNVSQDQLEGGQEAPTGDSAKPPPPVPGKRRPKPLPRPKPEHKSILLKQ